MRKLKLASRPPDAAGEPHREVRNKVLWVHRPSTGPGPGAPKLVGIWVSLSLKELGTESGACRLLTVSSLGLGERGALA